MATKTVINSNATRGISILIDQPQQQVEIVGSQQQQQQEQQRHAIAKINISPVATISSTKTLTTTTTTSYAASTSSAYSSLGSDEQPAAMTVNSNQQYNDKNKSNKHSTTFIDINCQDADAGADQILRTGSESQKSTTTFPQLLLKVAAAATAATNTTSQDQVNKYEVATITTTTTTTTTTPTSERRKTKTATSAVPTTECAAVKAENGERVQVGQSAVGISITHEHNNKSSSSSSSNKQPKLAHNDDVTTLPTTTTTIIACNNTQTSINHDDHVDDGHHHDHCHDDNVADDEHGNNTNHHDVAIAHDAIVESLRGRRDRRLSSDGAQVVVAATTAVAAAAAATTGTSSMSSSQRAEQLENFVTQTLNSLELADCASALTESVDTNAVKDSHVVKIKISPTNNGAKTGEIQAKNLPNADEKKIFSVFDDKKFIGENNLAKVSRVQLSNDSMLNGSAEKHETRIENIKLKINEKMVQKPSGTVTATTTPQGTTTSGSTTVTELNVSSPSAYLYYMMSSGQFSPCDTLDSGTGSDLESNGNGKNSSTNNNSSALKLATNGAPNKLELHLKTTKIRMHTGAGGDKQHHSATNTNGDHQRAGSLTDSEESESSLSCDSINSSDYLRHSTNSPTNGHHHLVPKAPPTPTSLTPPGKSALGSFLPDSLLRDIRDRKFPTNDFISKYVDNNHDQSALYDAIEESVVADTHNGETALDYQVVESHVKYARGSGDENMSQRASLPNKTFILNTADGTFVDTKMNSMPRTYEADKYYDFHVNEHENFRSFGVGGGSGGCDGSEIGDTCSEAGSWIDYEPRAQNEDAFAGYKDIRCSSAASTIRSSKGTVRGVRNRVRNGIATFLQLQQPNIKNFKEKDLGKVVLYTTSMGIIRDTYAKCSNMKQILRTLLIKFEERDVFMSVEYQQEIKERMHSEVIKVPQLFVEGQHIGDAETVERLNESGELRQLLKPYKSIATTYTCQTCGGYRLLPCPSCNGSKKSVHRNHFTAEFVALKCMNCDEVGLVKCHNC